MLKKVALFFPESHALARMGRREGEGDFTMYATTLGDVPSVGDVVELGGRPGSFAREAGERTPREARGYRVVSRRITYSPPPCGHYHFQEIETQATVSLLLADLDEPQAMPPVSADPLHFVSRPLTSFGTPCWERAGAEAEGRFGRMIVDGLIAAEEELDASEFDRALAEGIDYHLGQEPVLPFDVDVDGPNDRILSAAGRRVTFVREPNSESDDLILEFDEPSNVRFDVRREVFPRNRAGLTQSLLSIVGHLRRADYAPSRKRRPSGEAPQAGA